MGKIQILSKEEFMKSMDTIEDEFYKTHSSDRKFMVMTGMKGMEMTNRAIETAIYRDQLEELNISLDQKEIITMYLDSDDQEIRNLGKELINQFTTNGISI